MTDIYVILWIGAVAMAVVIGFWFRPSRRRKKEMEAASDTKAVPFINAVPFTRPIRLTNAMRRSIDTARPSYMYNSVSSAVETNAGFSEGLVIGSMLSASDPEPASPVEIPTFSGFGGGDSDGGGATSSWDPPSDSCSVDTSYSDSSSCSDSSSSSSGDS